MAGVGGGAPFWLLLMLALTAGGQCLLHARLPPPEARAESLEAAPSLGLLHVAALGEPVALAKLLMLRLQTYDNQPGISIPFRDLDYGRVTEWLDAILALDPRADYPLLFASRLYAEVPDPGRQRQMLDFVYRKFREDPNRRWPWLAHCSIIARHRLHDDALALRYARAIREMATGPGVPHWATQMEALLLADLNEGAQARILLGGLLSGNQVTEPRERHFLLQRLQELDAGAAARPKR